MSSSVSAAESTSDSAPAPEMTSALTLPLAAAQLTEATSIALAQAIQFEAIPTPLHPDPVITAYATAGTRTEAPPLLLLHGFDSSQLEFRRLLPLLAEGSGQQREVWLVDLLGFGFSDRGFRDRPTPIPLNPDTIKTHLHAFWQQKIGRPVVLVGASMGGAAAIDFALTYPECVDRLVLLDSAGYQNGPVIGKFLFPPVDQWAVEFLRRSDVRRKISLNAYFAGDRLVTPDAELCARLHLEMPDWDRGLKAFTKSGGYPKLRSRLSQLRAETLLIWGRQDRILGTKDAVPFSRAIPQGRLVWIENCGHVPHLEQPEAVVRAIRCGP